MKLLSGILKLGFSIALFMLTFWLAASPVFGQGEMSARDIARKYLPAIGQVRTPRGLGSGFFIEPGIFVTNYHVIEGATKGVVRVKVGATQAVVYLRIARVISFIPSIITKDLAVLSVPGAKQFSIPTIPLAPEYRTLEVGQTVFALGNPDGYVDTISQGIIAAPPINFGRPDELLQFSAPTSEGSSGGPLLDAHGEVVGVVAGGEKGEYRAKYVNVPQNINLAVPLKFLFQLIGSEKFGNDLPESEVSESDVKNQRYAPWLWPSAKPSSPSPPKPVATPQPKSAEDFIQSGNALLAAGRYSEAITEFSAAIRLNPKLAVAFARRAMAYLALSMNDLAISDCTTAIGIDPIRTDALLVRGAAYDASGRHEQAILDFSTVLDRDSNDLTPYISRAWAKVNMENGLGAFEDASRFLELNGLKGDGVAYAVIVGYLGQRRIGQGDVADKFLASWIKQGEVGDWTKQLFQFFSGQLTGAQLLGLATDNRKLTEAHAYIGAMQSLSGDKSSAQLHFVWVRNNGNRFVSEYRFALSELAKAGVSVTPTPTPVPTLPPPEIKSSPSPGEVRKMANGLELVWVSPGEFQMGSLEGEKYEKPPRKVTISEGFWMGRYEVTQLQWFSEMGLNPSEFDKCGGNCPVDNVSWDDIQRFIAKLNARNDGFVYSLPTEAQWEYAARAGTTGKYAGDLASMAWYKSNSNGTTHPVGTKQPNPFGLYDMHGNLWEWCEDRYGAYPITPETDPRGAANGDKRVLRGGSWKDGADEQRSAIRAWLSPSTRYKDMGFRVVARPKQ